MFKIWHTVDLILRSSVIGDPGHLRVGPPHGIEMDDHVLIHLGLRLRLKVSENIEA